jgi:hypothetical protein
MTLSLDNETFGETDLGWGKEYGPWKYRKLHDQQLTSVLTGVADPKTIAGVDCISFQPCLADGSESQDRYVVEDWELEDGIWKFLAVFDGIFIILLWPKVCLLFLCIPRPCGACHSKPYCRKFTLHSQISCLISY